MNYFGHVAVNNPPLQALQDGGVYNYGSSSAFPAGTFQGSNYWVDVVFNGSLVNDPLPVTVTTTFCPWAVNTISGLQPGADCNG